MHIQEMLHEDSRVRFSLFRKTILLDIYFEHNSEVSNCVAKLL